MAFLWSRWAVAAAEIVGVMIHLVIPFLLSCLWQSLGATTCRGLRVANTARLDANAHLVVAGILKRPPHFSELTWFPYLNGFVGLIHFRTSHSFSLLAVRHPGAEAFLPRRIQRIGSTPRRVRNRRSIIRPSARQIGIRQRASVRVKQSKSQQIVANSDASTSTRSQ